MSSEISVLRKLTIYNTSAQNNKEIMSSAMTWGDLQADLHREGIPFAGMRVVIGETQNELATNQSQLLPGEMTLFLVPRRVKSGMHTSHLVQPGTGITHTEIDWSDPEAYPENERFASHFDLGMALQKRAMYYLSIAAEHLLTPEKSEAAEWQDGQYEEEEDTDDDFAPIDNDEDDDYNEEEEIEEEIVQSEIDDWGFERVKYIDPVTQKLKSQADEIVRNLQG